MDLWPTVNCQLNNHIMAILEQARTQIHRHLLNKEIPHHIVGRKSVILESANSIGLLFDATLLADIKVVQEFVGSLEKKRKRVMQLGYFNRKLQDENFKFKHFSKKQLDWALRPKMDEATEFTRQPFDLLINLSTRSVLPLDYIAAHSKAQFRVGPFTENTFCYDLMIEQNEKDGLKDFLKQVLHYLEKMQPDIGKRCTVDGRRGGQ